MNYFICMTNIFKPTKIMFLPLLIMIKGVGIRKEWYSTSKTKLNYHNFIAPVFFFSLYCNKLVNEIKL